MVTSLHTSGFPASAPFRLLLGSEPARHSKSSAAQVSLLLIAIIALGLSACSVGPNYHRPPLDVPAEFRNAPPSVDTNSLGELPWWDVFKDPLLQDLLRTALTNKYDLRVAVARVEQARAILIENRALFFPQIGYSGEAARGRNAAGGTLLYNQGTTTSTFAAAANASWEIDLWGRIRRLNEAARAQYLASREARHDVTVSIISQVAQAYFRLLAIDEQLAIARSSTNAFGESYRIFSQRLEQGVVSKLETSAALAALASAAATVPEYERQIVIQENLINVLVGRNPGPVARHRTLLAENLALSIQPGLPSSLVERRPDIREAEANLRAANADVGVAVANFFPQLSLTGLFGQVSPELSAFTSGGATAWSAAANLAGPLFQGGRLIGQYRQARAVREEVRWRYQQTVLNAFEEVANALISLQKYGEERVQQIRAVDAYQVAVQVSMERYIAGRASYYEVLQEQQQLYPAENSRVQIELNQCLAFIQLYAALGGGYVVSNQ